MQSGRVWIGLAIALVAGIGIYQSVILPRQTQQAAMAATEAARQAAARAEAASEAARRMTAPAPRDTDKGEPVSR